MKKIPFDKGVNKNRAKAATKQVAPSEADIIDVFIMSKSIYYDPIIGAQFTPSYLK
jgi:hypothetical protein